MGQDGEAAAELVATIKGEHVKMKTWFNGPSAEAVELRKKYGDYPGLWKEVLNWKGWKEARKVYLQQQQRGEQQVTPGGGGGQAGVPRKRRSRWGSATPGSSDKSEGANKRRSRWGSDNTGGPAPPPRSPLPLPPRQQPRMPMLPGLPTGLSPHQQEQMRKLQAHLREVNERLSGVDREAARVDALPRGHRERSPSPPPVYGADGKRKNTRAVRWRSRLTNQQQDILEKLMSLNPATRSNALFRRKRQKKIPIPIDKHPNYNFIGLIIGPRGKTQKELEAKTGCKIAIRGKGSVKEGARGRRDGKPMEGEDEPLHVVITGEDQTSVDAATDMIEQMLVVIDDEKNVHKQQQLRELALLNGTLKEDEYCSICAEKGHRAFECPKRFAMKKNKALAVRCAICGDTSHPTRDCTQRQAGKNETNTQELDSDYMNFMAELDGKKIEKPPPAAPPGAEAKPPPTVAAAPPMGVTIIKPADKVPAATSGPPPPPMANMPPPPTQPPPPPPPANLPLPPPPGIPPPPGAGNGPPPPPGGGPPPPHQHYGYNNGHQGGGQGHYQQPPPQHGGYNQNSGGYNQQQQYGGGGGYYQQQQQHRGNDETQGWDYRSYYGGGGGAGAGGGFNWWEQS